MELSDTMIELLNARLLSHYIKRDKNKSNTPSEESNNEKEVVQES